MAMRLRWTARRTPSPVLPGMARSESASWRRRSEALRPEPADLLAIMDGSTAIFVDDDGGAEHNGKDSIGARFCALTEEEAYARAQRIHVFHLMNGLQHDDRRAEQPGFPKKSEKVPVIAGVVGGHAKERV